MFPCRETVTVTLAVCSVIRQCFDIDDRRVPNRLIMSSGQQLGGQTEELIRAARSKNPSGGTHMLMIHDSLLT